jgi:hypothetical protein
MITDAVRLVWGIRKDLRRNGRCHAPAAPPPRGEKVSIERRVRKLEEAAGQGEPCPECGHIAGKPTSDTLNWGVYWDYTGSEEPEDEFCSTCGAQLVFNVTWGAEGKQRWHPYDSKLRLVEDGRGRG